MCTAFKFMDCFCRNFDYDVSYNEELIIIPSGEFDNKYSVIGIGTGFVPDFPLLYDGMNEYGLCCGGLAFSGNAFYDNPENIQGDDSLLVPPYSFVFKVLGNFKTVSEVKKWLLKGIILVDKPYSDKMPNSDLHWFICDEKESIIIEQTKFGLGIYDGDVLTNNPPYSLQLEMYNTCKENIGNISIDNSITDSIYNTRGLETLNLDGSYTSFGRFERIKYLKEKMEQAKTNHNKITQSFHLLSAIEQVTGATPVKDKYEYTIYSVVYDMQNKTVWVKTYEKLCPTNFILTKQSERIKL